ncbi:peroxidase P7-like, partial [Amborella trichopoda]|uniref:peroxidase P7-like n=1 Tax=Amborella trichopoda TaxID=13333 RepID=UPI0005D2EC05
LGGPFWDVALGRRDSRTASKDDANTQLASPFDDLPVLISNFQSHGLSVRDLVALLGAHTIGFSRCLFFRDRIFNESNIHPLYAAFRQRSCPQSGGDDSLAALDTLSSNRFDNSFFGELVNNRGLLHSDQELFNGSRGPTDSLVWQYSRDWRAFFSDFSDSMMRLGNLGVLTGSQGEVRVNCRKPN